MTIKLTKEEMETHLYFNEVKEDYATIATFNTKMKNKIAKAALSYPDLIRVVSIDECGELIAELPKNLLSINIKTPKARAKKKQMTDAEKAEFVHRTRMGKAKKILQDTGLLEN